LWVGTVILAIIEAMTIFDMLKGAALVGTFIAILATVGLAIRWWDTTWKAAVTPTTPTRMSLYAKVMEKHSPCLQSFWHWRENGCRLI
jgi:hypothetical protein